MNHPLMRNNILSKDLQMVIKLLSEKDPKLTAGPRVKEFEDSWSNWLGVKHSIFLNSGSSSNLLALAWLKLKYPEGGSIVIPPFTWSSDVMSVIWMGFKPEFVDINLSTLAIDENKLHEKIDELNDIRAVFLTHAQGINGLTSKIIDLCEKHSIYLIEDVCESHGVRLKSGQKAGTKGILSCFSFYYAHHMSTIEGGMLCTNNSEIYQELRMMRSHGMLREASDTSLKNYVANKYSDLNPLFIFSLPGFNFRNNEIGAIIGLSQLKRLDSMIKKRADNFKYFLERLPSWAFTDFDLEGQSNYAFNIILKEADRSLMNKLEKTLTNNQVEFRRGSAGGGNQARQPYVKNFTKYGQLDPSKLFPVADHIHFYGMYIGNYPDLSFSEIDQILDLLKNV